MRSRVVVVSLASARLAFAQPAPPEEPPSPAARLFVEGRARLEAGKIAEACATFARSYELEPTAIGTMLNLGACTEQLGKLATARAWYARAEARATALKLVESETLAKHRGAVLAGKVATLTVRITDAPAETRVTLDGKPLAASELARIEVDAGHHAIDLATAPPVHRELDIADGAHQDLELAAPRPHVRPARAVAADRRERAKAYIFGGAGLGMLAATAVIGIAGNRAYHDGDYPDDFARSKNAVRYLGTPLFLGGAAALAYGTVLYLRGRHHELPVAPAISQDHTGVVFTKQF